MLGAQNGKALVMNADSDSTGTSGTLSVASGKTITSNKSDVTITAFDIDMDGALTAGINSITIHGAEPSQTYGLGDTSGQMHIDTSELTRITTTGGPRSSLTIGNAASAGFTIDGITAGSSDAIDIVHLIATKSGVSVAFTGDSSTFSGLSVTAHTSDTFQDDITVTSTSLLTMSAGATGLVNAGKLTLSARTGIYITDTMAASANGERVVMDADTDQTASGTLTVASTKTITSNKSDVIITAWDVDIAGEITAGDQAMSIHGAYSAQTIGLGAVSSTNMKISDGELGRLTATGNGLNIGTSHSGSINVIGVTASNSDTLTRVDLVATKSSKTISFQHYGSTFAGLSASAHTSTHFTDGLTVTSTSLMTMAATTAHIIPAGSLTLTANTGIYITNHMTGQQLYTTSDECRCRLIRDKWHIDCGNRPNAD
jgi:hypothetical protein